MKKILVAVLAAAVVLIPAGTAWARGDGWQYLPASPFDAACASTTVHVSIPVDREYGRFLEGPNGSTVLQITGSLVATYTTDSGASVTVNTGGPGKITFYTNGDVEVHGEGLNTQTLTEEQAMELGTPQIFLSKGLLDDIFHPDGSATPVRIPTNITDICAELGL